jgi:hypothetical protein
MALVSGGSHGPGCHMHMLVFAGIMLVTKGRDDFFLWLSFVQVIKSFPEAIKWISSSIRW